MKAIDYQPLRGDVCERIRERIVDGTYPAGSRLVERSIAADLGVSRVPVREALQTLVREGFAVERDTGGTAVRAYEADEIDELFDVRAVVEGLLVEQLTTSGADLGTLQASLDHVRQRLDAGDTTGAVAANARFHEAMAALGQGPLVRQLLADLDQRMRWLLRQHADPAAIHAEHRELVEAMESGDVDRAQEVNQRHMRTSRRAFDQARAR
jgi:DNA-binding GntR family transcriptional regulator